MQRFFSYVLIVLMSLSVVIPAAIPFYETCSNQLAGVVMEDLVEEAFAEIDKDTYTYNPLILIEPGLEQTLPVKLAFPCSTYPASQFLPGLVDVPPELS